MQFQLSDWISDSIVDGPGLRLTIFVQGCSHHCPGCHNPQTHDPTGGKTANVEDLFPHMDNPMLDGITLSGGEPFQQSAACAALARHAHAHNLNVWCYTGFTYEQLCASTDVDIRALLREVDVLVDGPYIAEQRSLTLLYRGSANQRIIDLKATERSGGIVLWQEE